MKLSIIVPVLNEAGLLAPLLSDPALGENGVEVLVVDGGSDDGSAGIAQRLGVGAIRSSRGRARQMNAGAGRTVGDALLFLHADTRLPLDAAALVTEALAHPRHVWGRFDVRIEGAGGTLRLVAWMMNGRSRLTGIATGDQALFMTRAAFERVGGFPDQPLMEDVEMSKRLRRLSPPACLRERVTTSGRRWETGGVWRTILLMWRLRFDYWRGVPPQTLAAQYR